MKSDLHNSGAHVVLTHALPHPCMLYKVWLA